jgi:hypothetical protein
MSDLHKEKTQTSSLEQSKRLEEVTLQSGAMLAATEAHPPHLAWAAARGYWPITTNLADPASTTFEE